MKLPDIKEYKTGATSDGGAPPDPPNLGAHRSNVEINNTKNAAMPGPSNVTGVVIDFASVANTDGAGTLTFTKSTNELQWTPPGGSIGIAVPFTVDATKVIYGSDTSMYIQVTVTFASFPGSDQTDSVTVNRKSATAPSNVTGVVINWASIENTNGAGTLTYVLSGKTLAWTPPGGSIGTAVGFTSDGTATLQGAITEDSINVTVVSASLPGSDDTDSITISGSAGSLLNNVYDDVTSAQAAAGLTDYACICRKNTHGSETVFSPKVWIANNTPAAGDTYEIGIEAPSSQPSGYATNNNPLPNDTTAPTGVTFSAPTTEATGIAIPVDLGPGEIYYIWRKRIVTAGAAAYPKNSATLAFSADINTLDS